MFRIFPFILIGKSTMAYLIIIGRNFDLECKHNKHKTAFQARKVTPRLSRNRPQNKDFSAVSQTDLTKVYCRLWRRPCQGRTRKFRKGENTCVAIHRKRGQGGPNPPPMSTNPTIKLCCSLSKEQHYFVLSTCQWRASCCSNSIKQCAYTKR